MSQYDENKVLDTIEKATKSVVNISTVKLVHNIFYQAVPVAGMGSGTIIDNDGLVLTNNHVVGGAEKINVTLWNNQVLEGTIVGQCQVHDTAVVRVKAKNLPAMELGDSDKLRVGQRVYGLDLAVLDSAAVLPPALFAIAVSAGLMDGTPRRNTAP